MEFQLVTRSRLITFLNTFFAAFALLALSYFSVVKNSRFNTSMVYLIVFTVILASAPLILRYFNAGSIWLSNDHFITRNRFRQMHQFKFTAADHINIIIRERGSEKLGENCIVTIEYYMTPIYKKAFAFVVPGKELKALLKVFQLWKDKGFEIVPQDHNGKSIQL